MDAITAAMRALRFDSKVQEAFLSLWRTFDRLRQLDDRLFAQFDLTAQQYNVLRLLDAAAPATVPTLALAHRLVSRAPDITRIIDKLQARGLLTRHRSDDDRRSVQVGITAAGARLLQQIRQPLAECQQRQLGHLQPEQLQQLIDLLRQARAPHEEPDSNWA